MEQYLAVNRLIFNISENETLNAFSNFDTKVVSLFIYKKFY